jgi:haloacetate dehalogenase
MVGTTEAFSTELRATYIEKFSDPRTIHAVCEEYRASATLDHQLDEADRGTRRIVSPVMVLWSSSGPFDRWDPLEVWRIWADDVRGGPIAAGHFLPEEAPEETAERLLDFLDQDLQKQEGDRN